MFRSLIICCFLVGLSYQAPIISMADRQRFNDECIASTGIEKSFVTNVFLTIQIPTDNEKYQEYLACYYKKQNYMDEDGNLKYENVHEFISSLMNENEVRSAVDACKSAGGETPGQKAVFFAKCMITNIINLEGDDKEGASPTIDFGSDENIFNTSNDSNQL